MPRGKVPRRWKSRRAGPRALRYKGRPGKSHSPPRPCWIPAGACPDCVGAGMTAVRASQASPLLGYNRLRARPFVVTPARAGVHPLVQRGEGWPSDPLPRPDKSGHPLPQGGEGWSEANGIQEAEAGKTGTRCSGLAEEQGTGIANQAGTGFGGCVGGFIPESNLVQSRRIQGCV